MESVAQTPVEEQADSRQFDAAWYSDCAVAELALAQLFWQVVSPLAQLDRHPRRELQPVGEVPPPPSQAATLGAQAAPAFWELEMQVSQSVVSVAQTPPAVEGQAAAKQL